MKKITLKTKKYRIKELEGEVKRLKEIIRWQSMTMANMHPPKLILKKEVEDGKRL